MINPTRFVTVGLLIVGFCLASMTFASNEANWVSLTPALEGSAPEVTVLESDEDHTQLRLDIPGYYVQEIETDGITYQVPVMPTAGFLGAEQHPELPVVTHWVAIPNTGSVELEVISNHTRQIPGPQVYPLQDIDNEYYPQADVQLDQAIYAMDELYPLNLVQVSEPMIVRDVRVVAVSWIPIRTNPSRGGLTISTSIEIDLRNTDVPGENENTHQFSRMTPSFYKIYQSNIVNFDELLDVGELTPGSLLIICPNNSQVTSRLAALVEWKTRKGYKVTLATTAQTGTNYSQIKSYIQTAYNTWDPPLEYVVLAGDAEGGYVVPVYSGRYDHGYTQLAGNDIIGDVAIGRLSFDNTSQLDNIVNKIVKYESDPYVTQTAWYDRAYLLAGTNHAYSTVVTSRYIKQQMEAAGITSPTIREYASYSIPVTAMRSYINAGALFMNYRGSWVGEMDCVDFQGTLTNGYMLPLAVAITCGTGTYTSSYSNAVSECWLREGSALNPAGAVACIGTATSGTHTRFNNIMNTGIFYGLFAKQLYNYGAALVEGKIQLVRAFPFDTYSQNNFSYWNNLMGDPSLEAWTNAPQTLNVTTASQVIVGQNYLTVEVKDAGNVSISGALVCLWKQGETFLTEYTGDTGILDLPITVTTTGTLMVTVTKHDYHPYLSDLNVVSGDFVAPVDWDIDDNNSGSSSGNNNGVANPGEIIELSVQLKNWGSSTATSVTGLLSENDEYLTITQNSSGYGSIASGSTTWSTTDYIIEVAGECPDDHLLDLSIEVTASGRPTYTSLVPIIVSAADLEFNSRTLSGGGNAFNPGETRQITVTLDNDGGFDATSVTGKLRSSHQLAEVTDSIGTFGNIQAASSGNNDSDRFMVEMNPMIFPGQPVTFTLILAGSGSFADTVTFEEIVGTPSNDDPTGPDNYGYWAFENIDTDYAKHPAYNWVEINGSPGSYEGTVIPLPDYSEDQDTSRTIDLPFPFYYYGEAHIRITVCSNGWLAMHDQAEMHNFRNFPIPGAHGPWGMIAPLWDDLVISSGHVYYFHDTMNHRTIVEWDNVRTRVGNYQETMQVILYDPAYYPTPTGDGEILIQYQVVHNAPGASDDVPYATVGIESPSQLDGIQYSYWNTYPSSAAGLSNGRAILFTTDAGYQGAALDTTGPEIVHTPLMDTFDTVGPYAVEANIWDISTVDHADLHYSGNGNPFTTVVMTTTTGTDWTANIPGHAPGTTISYYINAVDDSGNYAQSDTFSFDVWDVIYMDNFESGAPGWTHYSAGGGWGDQWHLSTEDSYSPVFSWKCGDTGTGNYADSLDAYLESPQFTLSGDAELHFTHRIESEIFSSYPDSAYDGGLMEISLDGGPWQQLYPTNAYTRTICHLSGSSTPYTGPFDGGTEVWAGTIAWTEVEADLSGHSGSTCRIRFRFGSDQSTSREGWFIDDFVVVGLPEGPLPIPENLVIAKLADNIFLNWDPVFGATYYTIYRATEPDAATWDSLGTVYEPTTNFHDFYHHGDMKGFYHVVAGN